MSPDHETARRRLFDACCRAAGVDPAVLDEPGITVAGEDDRSGSGVASAYELGVHLLVRCDPEIADACRAVLDDRVAPTLESFESAVPDGVERLGRGFLHVLGPFSPSSRADVRALDPGVASDVALIAELIAADPEGADDAEIELDELDDHAVGIVVDGSLAALVSERRWETDPVFGDIGVLSHPEHRRQGLARAALEELCRAMIAGDRIPLYRCNEANAASKALADAAGFVQVARLSAMKF